MFHIVYNPIAGKGRSARFRAELEPRLAALGVAHRFYETHRHGEAVEIVRKLTEAAGGSEIDIVAMGGDGTLNEVLNGMTDPGRVRLGVIPCGSGNDFATAAGIQVDRIRMLSVVMSTWLAAIGILMYEQGFGFIQLYMAPFNMALPAVSAILIGGASVNKATITNVVIGTILFQGIVTMTPTVMNNMIHMDISEVLRMVVSNGMILYALTRKTEVTR